MKASNLEAKQRIIDATINFISDKKDIQKITIRDIADKADVGIGLINYHFQTKENLINHCVQLIIGDVIGKFDLIYKSLDLSPIDKLKFMLKSTTSFLASNSGISRISILTDLTNEKKQDNSIQTMEAYMPILKEIYGNNKDEKELKIIMQSIISTLQTTFLHSYTFKEYSGIDFFDKEQREEFIEIFIDNLVGKKI